MSRSTVISLTSPSDPTLAHSASATLAFFLFKQHARHIPFLQPWYWFVHLPGECSSLSPYSNSFLLFTFSLRPTLTTLFKIAILLSGTTDSSYSVLFFLSKYIVLTTPTWYLFFGFYLPLLEYNDRSCSQSTIMAYLQWASPNLLKLPPNLSKYVVTINIYIL